jgi:broad specificity phosphatase PhoE
VITSDLARAVDSTQILAAAWNLSIDVDPRLRELNFGDWEGRTWDDLQRDDGARLSAWMQDWVHVAPPGGESFEALAARTLACRTDLSDGTLVVAHAGSIRALLCHAFDLPLGRAFDFTVDHARVSSLHLDARLRADPPIAIRMLDDPHLSD